MKSTYRVMQITRPGVLELAERPTPAPGPGEVLIEVEACGVCGADALDIEQADPALAPPRVPGHEVVGRIAAIGAGTPPLWQIGQRVGVGRLGGHCNVCEACRRGQFQLCRNQPFVGATCDGGYAELMLARSTALVSIPAALDTEEAAPILCAGIATFNALKKCGAEPGDVVAVLGIGGLGHMALQYARRMGFQVVAVGRGEDIAAEALALGAHTYLDTSRDDAAARLQAIGGAHAIIATAGDSATVSAMLRGLAPQGHLVLLSAAKDPLAVHAGPLVVNEQSVTGSLTGSPYEIEKTLNFSVLTGVRPRIEVVPLEHANDAYQKMRSGNATFRMVLTMNRAPSMPVMPAPLLRPDRS
jgi:alcohol dehydrogenase